MSDLASDGGHERKDVVIRLANFSAKKLHDALDGAAEQNGKGRGAMQPDPFSHGKSRKVGIMLNIDNPGRSPGFPDTSRQADPSHKCPLPAGRVKGFDLAVRLRPTIHAPQDASRLIDDPENAEAPPQR